MTHRLRRPTHTAAAAIAVALALTVLLGMASTALAAGVPLAGTVTATNVFRERARGPIITRVTLATAQGRADFDMPGGTLGGIGMLTDRYVRLKVGDRVAVAVTDDAMPLAVEAPVILAGTGGVSASAVTDYIYDGRRWSDGDMPLDWRFNSANAPGGALAAIQSAAGTWESDPLSEVDFDYAGATAASPADGDDVNTIGWLRNVNDGTLAMCSIWYYETAAELGYNRIVEFDIDFNRAFAWSTSGAAGTYDIQSVALHELGHTLHLGDLHDATPTSSQEVMNGYLGDGEILRVLGAGDLAGARAIYPDDTPGDDPPPPPPPPPPADTSPPVTAISGIPAGWTRNPVTVSLSASDARSGISATYYRIAGGATQVYSAGIPVSAEGSTLLGFWSVDGVGNVEAERATSILIDRGVPTVSSDGVAEYQGFASVRISGSDSVSGVTRIVYRIDGGSAFTVSGPVAVASVATVGSHRVDFTAEDAAGNTASGSASFVVVPIDHEAPVTSVSGIPAQWTSGDVTVTLTAPGADVAATYYRVAGGPRQTYSAPVVISAEGETTLEYWSVDRGGNEEVVRRAVSRIDRTAPSVSPTPAATYTNMAVIGLRAEDALSGISSFTWCLDGGALHPAAASYAEVYTPKPGRHTLTFSARDAAGNSADATSTFTVMTGVTIPASPGSSSLTATRRRGVASTKLSATIKRTTGAAVPRARVLLQRSSNGRMWTTVARLTATSAGKVSKTVTSRKAGTTYWRWHVDSSPTLGHFAANSRPLRLRVR